MLKITSKNLFWSIDMTDEIVQIKKDLKTGEYFFELPKKLIDSLEWEIGTTLEWTDCKDGSFLLSKAKSNSNKLCYDAAMNLIQEAHIKVKANKGYRFGQALTNLLPSELYNFYNGTDKDFFYWTDYDMILNTFYRHYVE